MHIQSTHSILPRVSAGMACRERFDIFGKASVAVAVYMLIVIQLSQLPGYILCRRDLIFLAALCEEYESPQFRIVNIDHSCRSPHPVVLRQYSAFLIGALYILAVDHIHIPLYSGEVHTVILSRFRRALLLRHLIKRRKRHHNFNHPTLILRVRVIDLAVHLHSASKSVDIPAVQRPSPVAVWLGKKQIPDRILHIHLILKILMGIGIRVNEDLKIIVIEDYAVALCQMAPDLISLQHGAEVEVLVVPEHLRSCAAARRLNVRAFNIHKQIRIRSIAPELLLHIPVQNKRAGCPAALVNRRGKINSWQIHVPLLQFYHSLLFFSSPQLILCPWLLPERASAFRSHHSCTPST